MPTRRLLGTKTREDAEDASDPAASILKGIDKVRCRTSCDLSRIDSLLARGSQS